MLMMLMMSYGQKMMLMQMKLFLSIGQYTDADAARLLWLGNLIFTSINTKKASTQGWEVPS